MFGGINFGDLVKNLPILQIKITTKVSGYTVDALRLLLRPFWDRSRIIVATCLADNCIKFLAVHVHMLSKLTWNFYHKKVLWLAEQQAGNITT